MDLNEAKELLEENGYILDEGIFDSIKNKFFKKKEVAQEVQPMKKKLYDDQIAKTSEQAYNHTTESMSVLKQVATNFNGKKASEFKQLWSGLSKLLNKHGMSVKNHNYYLGVTNNNAEFSVWAYIANPETDWTDIKIIGRVKANVSEYKYTTNYDLDDSSLKGQAEDLNEWLVELDSIALKLFKGASREEWEEGAHQNESKVNKAIKLLESVGYIVEDTDTHDDEEFAFDMKKRNIFKSAKNRVLTDEEDKEIDSIDRKLNKIPSRDSVWQKKMNAGIWAIKLTVSTDAYDEEKDEYVDDYTLGYLKPDGTVAKTYGNDCMLNYRQCQDLIDKYARYKDGPAKPGFEKALKQKFKITDKQATIFLSPGTIKRGKFYLFNMEDSLYDAEEV